jgi:hypothetical protein
MSRIMQLVAVMLLVAGNALTAQEASPIKDLLATARSRLNDLQYRDAESIIRAVTSYPGLRRADRIQALQLLAAAQYPEHSANQLQDSAVATIRQLIRIAPHASIPRELSWRGLDSLVGDVRYRTFGASATVRQANPLTGPDERVSVEVTASRPAYFTLSLHGLERDPISLDSIGPVERGSLRFAVLKDRTVLPAGPGVLVVAAIDPSGEDTAFVRFDANLTAPTLEFLPIPISIDTTKLLPEMTKPRKPAGIVGGALFAASTIIAAQVLRESAFKDAIPRDGRAARIGVALGIGIGAGVWFLDKGAPIKKNVEANRELRRAFSEQVVNNQAENDRRIASYKADVRINPEPKP